MIQLLNTRKCFLTHYIPQEDLCELGFLDIVHPCDQELVKEQLLVTDCDHPIGEKKSTAADFNMVSNLT